MSDDRLRYEPERFARSYRARAMDKRLAFDAWADRQSFGPDLERRLRRTGKALGQRRAA